MNEKINFTSILSKSNRTVQHFELSELVHITHYRLTGKEKHIGGWDLIWLDGPVPSEDPGAESGLYSANYSHNSFLGIAKASYSVL